MEQRFFEHECSRFRRIGTKFGTDDGLGLEWVQREAPKSYLQNFQNGGHLNFQIFGILPMKKTEWDRGAGVVLGAEPPLIRNNSTY